jgi:hypothetical protein
MSGTQVLISSLDLESWVSFSWHSSDEDFPEIAVRLPRHIVVCLGGMSSFRGHGDRFAARSPENTISLLSCTVAIRKSFMSYIAYGYFQQRQMQDLERKRVLFKRSKEKARQKGMAQ